MTYPKTLDDQGIEYEKKEFKEYDILGNVVLEVDPLGIALTNHYTVHGAPYLIEYPNGACERYEYSPQGLNLKYTAINGTVVTREYDELSKPI